MFMTPSSYDYCNKYSVKKVTLTASCGSPHCAAATCPLIMLAINPIARHLRVDPST